VRFRSLAVLTSTLAACGACSDDHAPVPVPERQPQRRVIEPPSGIVQAGPPYVIGVDSVGPYKLRQNVASLADRLKGGPGMMRFEIPGILHAGLIRAEDDTVLIGTEPTVSAASTTTFVAVIGADVAQLEQGVHVGSSRAEAEKLGVAAEDPERAHDPRLVMSAIGTLRFVIEKKRVVAIVLVDEPSPAAREPTPVTDCPRPATTAPSTFGICLGTGELVEVDGDDLVVRASDADKPMARTPVPGLMWAVPLRNAAEGHDELIAIARNDEPNQRTWSIAGYRLEGGQLRRAVDPTPLYQISSAQTRWIGTDLGDIELYIELTSKPDGIEVGGLLTTRGASRVRDLVVISSISVPRRHRKPPPAEIGDAGVSDADLLERSRGSGSR